MRWDCYVMIGATHVRLQSKMTASLPNDPVAVSAKDLSQVVTGEITRQSQTGMTSSFTMCKRIMAGAEPIFGLGEDIVAQSSSLVAAVRRLLNREDDLGLSHGRFDYTRAPTRLIIIAMAYS